MKTKALMTGTDDDDDVHFISGCWAVCCLLTTSCMCYI